MRIKTDLKNILRFFLTLLLLEYNIVHPHTSSRKGNNITQFLGFDTFYSAREIIQAARTTQISEIMVFNLTSVTMTSLD